MHNWRESWLGTWLYLYVDLWKDGVGIELRANVRPWDTLKKQEVEAAIEALYAAGWKWGV